MLEKLNIVEMTKEIKKADKDFLIMLMKNSELAAYEITEKKFSPELEILIDIKLSPKNLLETNTLPQKLKKNLKPLKFFITKIQDKRNQQVFVCLIGGYIYIIDDNLNTIHAKIKPNIFSMSKLIKLIV